MPDRPGLLSLGLFFVGLGSGLGAIQCQVVWRAPAVMVEGVAAARVGDVGDGGGGGGAGWLGKRCCGQTVETSKV